MNKKNLILGGVLLALLGLAFLYQGPFRDWKSELGKPSNFLKGIDVAKITKMEISEAGKTMVINKQEDKWLIEGTKAFYLKSQVAATVLDSLIEAKKSDIMLVSENAEKKAEFEIGEESGAKLVIKNGDEVLKSFYIGKNGGDFKSTYIAEMDSDKIYTVDANLNLAFRHDDWFDRTIFSLDKDSISKIRFQYPSREFSIERTKDEEGQMGDWSGILPYKFSTDQEKVNEIVDTMANLKAVAIPAQSFEGTGLEKNLIIIQVTGEDIDAVLMVGEDNGGEAYFAKKGDSDNIYLISKEDRDALEKRISSFR